MSTNLRMSDEETAIRRELESCVRAASKAIRRCPTIGELDVIHDRDVVKAQHAAAIASKAVSDALRLADRLERLPGVTPEGRVAADATRATFGMVRELVTVLVAAIDCRSEAA